MEKIKIVSSDCQIVSGYLRNAIYDLTRQKYYLLEKFSSIDELRQEVIDFLEDEEVLLTIPSNLKPAFPIINLEYQSNQIISACQIKYFGAFDVTKITALFCRDFSLIISDFSTQIEGVKNIIDALNNEPINSVQLHITDVSMNARDFKELREVVLNFSFCVAYVYDSYFDYQTKTQDLSLNISFFPTRTKLESKHFYINIKVFTESQKQSLFYNQFLLIDESGNIKNAAHSPDQFGSISELNYEELKQIVLSSRFNYLMNITKNDIDVCKNCEFKHMCCDDKFPLKRGENDWYYQEECHYNPYIAKWSHEEGYKTLAECGVTSNEHEFSIDHEKIALINKELWEDE